MSEGGTENENPSALAVEPRDRLSLRYGPSFTRRTWPKRQFRALTWSGFFTKGSESSTTALNQDYRSRSCRRLMLDGL